MIALNVDLAACKDVENKDIFFPEGNDKESYLAAKEICKSCPIALDCFNFSIENSIPNGIWGGIGSKTRMNSRYKPRELERLRKKIINKEQ